MWRAPKREWYIAPVLRPLIRKILSSDQDDTSNDLTEAWRDLFDIKRHGTGPISELNKQADPADDGWCAFASEDSKAGRGNRECRFGR